MAQDELQVAEHPGLAAVREALMISARNQLFTNELKEPTPIVVMGVERRCEVATDPNDAAGRPNGIYGRLFSAASPEVVKNAVRRIEPPTRSNILAIEAPSNGSGQYRRSEIDLILRTAYSGFMAATIESKRRLEGRCRAIHIHTGFWGCGVYGNDRVLIALLQFLAARLAGVDRLVFYTVDAAGAAAYEKAASILHAKVFAKGFMERLFRGSPVKRSLFEIMNQIEDFGFRWGQGDGN